MTIEHPTGADDTLLDMFGRMVSEAPQSSLLWYFGTELTAAEVDTLSDALAYGLAERGFGRGDRVALYLQNVPAYVIAQLAAWKLGGIVVAINPMLKVGEVEKLIHDSNPAVLVAMSDSCSDELMALLGRTSVGWLLTTEALDWRGEDESRSALRAGRIPAERLTDVLATHRGKVPAGSAPAPEDTAVITYTSGTTGVPKGAMNTHRNVAVGGRAYRDWFELDERDVILGIAPLFHVTGLTGHIACAIAARAALVLCHRFEVSVVLDVLRTRKPTFTVGAITAFLALANSPQVGVDDLSSLRVVASGGAPVAAATVAMLEDRFGHYVHNVYGMTETTCPALAVPVGARAPLGAGSGALSVGKPMLGAQVRVLDEHSGAAASGVVGELAIRGAQVVPGYWHNPDATGVAFRGGWLLTGDVGYRDDDGWYYLVDRKKDVIIASGYKVWPREVEDVLYGHPAVLEAAVVGEPDEYRGETVTAFVSLRDGCSVQPQELIDFCRVRLAAYKYPRRVQVVDLVPKTATGKILRRSFRSSDSV